MKQTFNSIKILGLATVLAVGISYVSAYTPIAAPGNLVQPINTGAIDQITKTGGILSQKSFISGPSIAEPASYDGFAAAKTLAGSAYGLFNNQVSVPGTTSKVKIGSATTALGAPLIGAGYTTPLTVDLSARAGVAGQNAVEILSGNSCKNYVTVKTNTAGIRFASNSSPNNPDNVDLIARQLQLKTGTPGAMKVLVATNDQGDAVWGTLSIVNGALQVNYAASPVTTGQCEIPSNPISGCMNPAATNYNPAATIDDNSCIISGCMDPSNENYNPNATVDDGSCTVIEEEEPGIFAIGCFLADTQVTLANGVKKNIQDIKVGDRLKAVNGFNTVQKLLRPVLNDKPAYSINGSKAFFTANHPFLTTDGWKSLDPETTRKEIPTLVVSLMQIGDVLVTETGTITIHSIASAHQSTNTQLYNFELDGDHTYYANGYAVHNKEQVPANNPNPSCDFDQSTLRSDCTELNNYYCSISSGNTQGQCIPSRRCTTNADCQFGPTIGTFPDQIQLVNGRCLMPTSWVHPADQGKKFCKW